MEKVPFTPKFTLAQLKKLPTEMQAEGAKIEIIYNGFKNVTTYLLAHFGRPLIGTYERYLRHNLVGDIQILEKKLEEIKTEEDVDHRWRWSMVSSRLAFDAIYDGHWRIELAHSQLKQKNLAEYALRLSEAGVYFGRLTMIADLCELDVYDQIGSVQSAIAGATIGGKRSGETRRKQSLVPTSSDLRLERERLVKQGKPSREVSAMLAKMYGCTTDHIRKLLKRE